MNQALAEAEQQEQLEHISAKIKGESVEELPKDLYVPPDALLVFLQAFEGPLDFLLYLIRKNNLDIVDIPIAAITEQYMSYIEVMKDMRFELAAEYLLMAATLAEIKSRMLLPKTADEEIEEEDPRAELVRRLQEYERFKQAALDLDELPRLERDIYMVGAEPPNLELDKPLPDVDLQELLLALNKVLKQVDMTAHHHVARESLSIRERMTIVLDKIAVDKYTDFGSLFTVKEGRLGVVVTFIAVLELLKLAMIEIVQSESFSPIYIKAVAA